MDDLKLLGRNENDLKNEIKIVQTISKDINMMSINVQHDAAICRLLFSVTLLDMFRVSCTHHQEYQKLYLRPLVHVIL